MFRSNTKRPWTLRSMLQDHVLSYIFVVTITFIFACFFALLGGSNWKWNINMNEGTFVTEEDRRYRVTTTLALCGTEPVPLHRSCGQDEAQGPRQWRYGNCRLMHGHCRPEGHHFRPKDPMASAAAAGHRWCALPRIRGPRNLRLDEGGQA
jgi:hypothetical protein